MKKRLTIDLNAMARDVTLREGQKHSLSIGDCKEVIRLVLDRLANDYPASVVLALLEARRGD